jgi:glucose-6-phosphate-specific signal transduction histidine kinase
VDAREAQQALTQAAHRRQQTITAGTTPWTRAQVWSLCSCALALGVLVDAGMVWLWVILMLMGVGVAWQRGVRLKPTRASSRWQGALVATLLPAIGVNIAFQTVARGLEWPLPNTLGMLGTCLVSITLTRAVQARMAASLRP